MSLRILGLNSKVPGNARNRGIDKWHNALILRVIYRLLVYTAPLKKVGIEGRRKYSLLSPLSLRVAGSLRKPVR